MSDEFHHSIEIGPRQPKPRRRASDPISIRESELAQFDLLADPATISGGLAAATGDERDEEVERLRSALHARSREVAAMSHENPTAHTENSEGHGPLLNSAEARQLAQDARVREQACRAALASAHEALQNETPRTRPPIPPDDPPNKKTSHGWQQRSLVRSTPEPDAPPTSTKTSPVIEPEIATATPSMNASLVDEQRDARAEIRELRATLAIARETTIEQKKDIARLRNEIEEQKNILARAPRQIPSLEPEIHELRHALEEARSERSRLIDRLRLNECETETRDAERILLRQTLAERESEIAARSTQLDELRERFDAQDRALHNARLQFERERSQNTATQALLTRLRQALGVDLESSLLQGSLALTDPGTEPAPTATSWDDSNPDPVESVAEPDLPVTESPERIPSSTEPTNQARPPIFDAWQDDQIRRHFGPMGIDTIVDLLRAPLARRISSEPSEQKIVLIGRGAWSWAATLADGLVQNGAASFTLHVADPDHDGMGATRETMQDDPTREFLRSFPFPQTPRSLMDSLMSLDPVALVSRDFLSMIDEVRPWLEPLSEYSKRGSCLLFSERTGIDLANVPDEIREIGDRIWELMPDRYTRVGDTQECLTSWHEAFARSQQGQGNDLLSALRDRFQLEMLTQFGFLAEPFLGSPIGSHFDANAARDRKFLNQIADIDDRKIEAGTIPALHLVAVVDSESDH